jgi:hypothetical protein
MHVCMFTASYCCACRAWETRRYDVEAELLLLAAQICLQFVLVSWFWLVGWLVGWLQQGIRSLNLTVDDVTMEVPECDRQR